MGAFESSRTFFKTLTDLEPVALDVSEHFRNQGYTVQSDRRLSGSWDVSITKSNIFKAVCGLRTALKIEIVQQNECVFAKASIGIFGQQVIPSIITVFLFWPILIPQIWGIISQSKLDDEALRVIEDSLTSHASKASLPSVIETSTVGNLDCAGCGGKVPPGSSFCPSCGKRAKA